METMKAGKGSNYSPKAQGGSFNLDGLVLVVIAVVVIFVISQFSKAKFSDFFKIFRSSSAPTLYQTAIRNPDRFRTLAEVQEAIRKAGLESSNLIIGIDFTKSNTWTGAQTFGGFCLHDVSRKGVENPYQKVIRIIGKTLNQYDEDSLIPVFGFGDVYTKGTACFPFLPDRPCHGLREVLDRYEEIVSGIDLSGPTNFAPIIYKAIEVVKQTTGYHILVIIADGQVDKLRETIDAIVAASHHPLSIVCVGVGDGPWDAMEHFDDHIPHRRFDNFQFVNMRALEAAHGAAVTERFEAAFATAALMELPDQFNTIRRMGLL